MTVSADADGIGQQPPDQGLVSLDLNTLRLQQRRSIRKYSESPAITFPVS